MSGDIGFLITLPLAAVALPFAVGGLAAAGVVRLGTEAGKAAYRYESNRREEREMIYRSGIRDEITDYRSSVQKMMNDQKNRNRELSREFEKTIEENRKQFAEYIAKMDVTADDFSEEINYSAEQMIEAMQEKQHTFQLDYQKKIVSVLEEINRESQKRQDEILSEIREIYMEESARKSAMAKAARSYIEEVRDLLTALQEQFYGEKYMSGQVLLHQKDFREVTERYNREDYQACMIAGGSLMAKLRQDILTCDELHQENENWHKTAEMLVSGNLEFLKAQKTLSEEIYRNIEEESRRKEVPFSLMADDIGTDLSIYWGKTEKNTSVFQEMQEKLETILDCLNQENCPLSTSELKEIALEMSGKWRCEIIKNSARAVERWNNAMQREKMALDIIDHMEECGYIYNEEFAFIRHRADGEVERVSDEEKDAQLCMKFIDSFGDEILVRLSDRSGQHVGLEITDMAEEIDPEVDKSRERKELEEEIRSMIYGGEYQGTARGGCVKGTENIVAATPKTRKIKNLVEHKEE